MDINHAEAIYPVSPLQEAVLAESLTEQERSGGGGRWSCTLRGPLDESKFEQAWQQVVNRHPILRTFFVWKRIEKPLQVVHKQLKLSISKEQRPAPSPAAPPEPGANGAERPRVLDPSVPPLIHLTLRRASAEVSELTGVWHPLILDERSLGLLLDEAFANYAALVEGRIPSPPSTLPFRSYLAWLKRQDAAEAETFWRQALAGFHAPTARPAGLERLEADGAPSGYGERSLLLDESLPARLREWAAEHALSPSTILYGAWALLLHCYGGEDDLLFGITGGGCPAEIEGSETLIGPLSSTLPLRVRIRADVPVLSWLRELEASIAERSRFAYVSTAQVRKWSGIHGDGPLFGSSVNVEAPPHAPRPSRHAGLEVSDVEVSTAPVAPLVLGACLDERGAWLRLTYEHGRVDEDAAAGLLGHVRTLLEGMLAHPDQALSRVPLLSEAELHRMLVEWNETETDERHDKCIHQLFEEQAARTPETLAVVSGAERLTYAELDRRSNQLANYLRRLGVGGGVLVGLCVERSPEMVIGMMAVMKAGGAYVPLDPSYPFERLTYMLSDARPPVLLSQEHLVAELPAYHGKAICLDTDWDEIERESGENPGAAAGSEDLAYVIYTSGSTGRPKGVMVPHRGVCNSSKVYARVIGMPPGSRMLQLTSLGFDMSVFDIVPALISGLTLCLAPQRPPLGPDLLSAFVEQEIEVVSFPPSMLATLPPAELPRLGFIGVAGEAISAELVSKWAPGRRFYNAYGPAEGSIWVSGVFLDGSGPPVIGRPIDNLKLYVVDAVLRPVPVGVPGELCIGGPVAVTWGYLRQPGLTAERYVPDPFSGAAGGRLYRTGDLARYLPDGNLEFLGRTDSQVKIRGFRVELGEVEAVLGRHPAVREVVVLAREDTPGDKRLVAYVLPHQGQTPTVEELQDYLRQKLPENMVPSAFMLLDEFPLSPNGKVDRRELPAPDAVRPQLQEVLVAPRNQTEEVLAGIWAEVLKLERVGVRDNFFRLGGHSLLATQVVSRVREALQVDISLPQLFDAPTIAELGQTIQGIRGADSAPQEMPIVPLYRETHRLDASLLETSD